MATYKGTRDGGNALVTVDGAPLPPRNDLKNHSPDGVEWGYSGSGPSQLALAVLAHYFLNVGDEQELADAKALALYHPFKDKLIAKLPGEGWAFDSYVVADTVKMVVKDDAERLFTRATQLEVENQRLNRNLDECYMLLEEAEAETT